MRYYQLAVFNRMAPFSGNQLAVVTDYSHDMTSDEMTHWAREFNFSETVFLDVKTNALRIFTPVGELPFAGHPTIGTAWLIAHLNKAVGTVKMTVPRGPIEAKVTAHGSSLPFPGQVHIKNDMLSDSLCETLNLRPCDVGQVYEADAGPIFKMIEVNSHDAIKRATPSLGHPERVRTYLFYRASEDRFNVRMFGIALPEDPATGSAACALGGYLQQVAGIKSGTFTIQQGDEMKRPSEIHLTLDDKIHIGGQVRLVVEGRLI